MVADVGTRRGAKLSDVIEDRKWTNGLPRMSGLMENFLMSMIELIKLDNTALQNLHKEQFDINPKDLKTLKTSSVHVVAYAGPKVKERYEFSLYFLDPDKYRF